jgi:hypothetical protein
MTAFTPVFAGYGVMRHFRQTADYAFGLIVLSQKVAGIAIENQVFPELQVWPARRLR